MKIVVAIFYGMQVEDEAQAMEAGLVARHESERALEAHRQEWDFPQDELEVIGHTVMVVDNG